MIYNSLFLHMVVILFKDFTLYKFKKFTNVMRVRNIFKMYNKIINTLFSKF